MEVFAQEVHELFDRYLTNCLQKVVNLFEALGRRPRTLWSAVRRSVTTAEGASAYATILRVGKIGKDRTSSPVPADRGLPKYLREQYGKNQGIVILGTDRNEDNWVPSPNDQRKEDLSVMAGPIMIKSGNPLAEATHRWMYMILYVNSPEVGAFGDGDRYYMRCCTDVLSLFFSMVHAMIAETGFELIKLQPPVAEN